MKMTRTLIWLAALLGLLLLAVPEKEAQAACSTQSVDVTGTAIIYSNDCTNDNEVLVQTGDMLRYDSCLVMSTTGAVDIFVSIDGTNYSTAALSLQDYGATTTNPVLLTVADRVYGFVSKFRFIRVLQNGAADAEASLVCWMY